MNTFFCKLGAIKSLIAIISTIILFTGCSNLNKNLSNPEKENRLRISATYFSLAETAIQMEDINTAIFYYKKADEANPDNIYIKEKLIQLLAAGAYFDKQFHEEIIRLGKNYFKRDLYSTPILLTVADSYIKLEQPDKAEKFLKKATEITPNMKTYTSYYLYQKQFKGNIDDSLLEKALKSPCKNPEDIFRLASIYKESNPAKAISLLEKSYDKWEDEKTFGLLLSLYEINNNTGKIITSIQTRINSMLPVSDRLKTYLVGYYFQQKQYNQVIKNKNLCFEVNTNTILRYLFFAAINTQDYELAIKAGYAIENAEDLPDELKASFYSYLGNIFYNTKQDQKAVEYFIKTNNINILLQIFNEIYIKNPDDPEEQQRIKNLLHLFYEQCPDKDISNFLAGYYYTLIEDDTAQQYLDKVPDKFIQENSLQYIAALSYLSATGNIAKAEKILLSRTEQTPTINEIFGFYYLDTNSDSLAYHYFVRELEENPQPKPEIFILTSMLADKFNDIPKIALLLEKGADLFPDNATILNAVGYFIASHEINDQYDKALTMLKKAVELEPEDEMIWDSLAWLYLRMGQYQQALESMQLLLQHEVDNSEIAYHLGEIYLKLNNITLARKYLSLSIELNNEKKSVEISRKILNKLDKE